MRIGGCARRLRRGVFFVQQPCGGCRDQRGRAFFGRFIRVQEFVEVPVEIAGVDLAGDDGRMPHETFEELDVRFRSDDVARRERFAHAHERELARRVPGDELGDHRVVEDRDRIAFDDAGVDAHVRRGLRQAQALELAGTRQEILLGILGVEAQLDRVTTGLARAGSVRFASDAEQIDEGFAGGNAQLQLDEIEPEHHLGDRMLDLQARVDLHEIEIAGLADDELDRAGVDVVERARGRDRGFAHLRAQLGRHERRGRFLEHFLVAPLRRAFALVEMHDVAVRVAEHLELDVARALDVAFEQHAIATECVLRFAAAAVEIRGEFARGAHDAHALAAAAVRGLDHQRKTDRARLRARAAMGPDLRPCSPARPARRGLP